MLLPSDRFTLFISSVFIASSVALLAVSIHSDPAASYAVELRDSEASLPDALLPDAIGAKVAVALDSVPGLQTILRLRDRESGVVSTFSAVLTHFGPQRPFPSTASIGKNALVVRSTDERRTPLGLTAAPIAAGCALPEPLTPALSSGGASKSVPCRGAYSNAGIAGVIDVVAVPWKEAGCWSDDRTICVRRNLRNALGALIESAHGERHFDVLLLPPLGTGAGGLNQASFYEAFAEIYGAQLPGEIARIPEVAFGVFDEDWRNDREHLIQAIGKSLSEIAIKWKERVSQKHAARAAAVARRRQLSSTVAGLLLSMTAVLLARPGLLRTSANVSTKIYLATIAGFLLLAFPVATGLDDLSTRIFTEPSAWLTFCLAVTSVPLLGAVTYIKTVGEKRLKDQTAPALAGEHQHG